MPEVAITKEKVAAALAQADGSQTAAAKLLGVSQAYVSTLVKRYELQPPRRTHTKEEVEAALSQAEGNQEEASRILKTSRPYLTTLVQKYGLRKPRGKHQKKTEQIGNVQLWQGAGLRSLVAVGASSKRNEPSDLDSDRFWGAVDNMTAEHMTGLQPWEWMLACGLDLTDALHSASSLTTAEINSLRELLLKSQKSLASSSLKYVKHGVKKKGLKTWEKRALSAIDIALLAPSDKKWINNKGYQDQMIWYFIRDYTDAFGHLHEDSPTIDYPRQPYWKAAADAADGLYICFKHIKKSNKGKKTMSTKTTKSDRLHGAAAVAAARKGGYTIFLAGDATNPRPKILSLADAEKWVKKSPARIFATPRGVRKPKDEAAKHSRAPRMPKAPGVRVNVAVRGKESFSEKTSREAIENAESDRMAEREEQEIKKKRWETLPPEQKELYNYNQGLVRRRNLSVRGVVGFESMLQALAHTTDAHSLARAWGNVMTAYEEGSLDTSEYARLRTVGTYLEEVFTTGAAPSGKGVPADLKPYWKTHGHNVGASSEKGTQMTPKKKKAASKKTSPKKKAAAAKKAPAKKKKKAAKKKVNVSGTVSKKAPAKKKAAPKKKKAAPKKAAPKKAAPKKAAPKKAPAKKKAAPKKKAAKKKVNVSVTVGKKAPAKKTKKAKKKSASKSQGGASVLKLKKHGKHFVAIVKKGSQCFGRGYTHIVSHSKVLDDFAADPSCFAPCKPGII